MSQKSIIRKEGEELINWLTSMKNSKHLDKLRSIVDTYKRENPDQIELINKFFSDPNNQKKLLIAGSTVLGAGLAGMVRHKSKKSGGASKLRTLLGITKVSAAILVPIVASKLIEDYADKDGIEFGSEDYITIPKVEHDKEDKVD